MRLHSVPEILQVSRRQLSTVRAAIKTRAPHRCATNRAGLNRSQPNQTGIKMAP